MQSQYGEETLILAHTLGKRGGFVVDVGAGDGFTISNSAFLIAEYGWGGVLIDPLPEFAAAMRQRYGPRSDVRVCEAAVASVAGKIQLWPGEFGTTALPAWRDRMAAHHGTKYGEPITVECWTLTQILDAARAPRNIDFLTVDCEGMDQQVLDSLDWNKYGVDLVCVEAPKPWPSLVDFMAAKRLLLVGTTAGNALFGRSQ